MRQSVFLQNALKFLVLYTIYSACFLFYDLNRSFQESRESRIRSVSNYLRLGRDLIKSDDTDELIARLSDAMEAHDIDFYILRDGKETVAIASAAGADDNLYFPETDEEYSFESKDWHYMLIQEGTHYLAIGYKRNFLSYVRIFLKEKSGLIINDLLFVSLIGLLLMLYSFRDLRDLLRRLRGQGGRSKPGAAHSLETLTLIQGIKAYQTSVDSLSKENALLKNQVLSALRKEISSGKTPPYEFGCTLVRTDINNFTSLFSTRDRAEFMATVNEFFVGVTKIVSRYQGYIYEFIGDEVLYYFKDEEHKSASRIAISALRDIHRLAEAISETTTERGYEFHIKTSLSSGTLRFGPLVNGFSLAGGPLIETVRLLSHVQDKSGNSVLFEESFADRVSALSVSRESGVVLLKGLKGSRRLRVHERFVPLSHHLRQASSESLARIQYYRGDREICEILDFVRERFKELAVDQMMGILSQFKTYHVVEATIEVRSRYFACLNALFDSCVEQNWRDEPAAFAYGSLIACAAHFFNPGELTGRLREILLKTLHTPNRRVVANALDVFAVLDADSGDAVFEKLANHEDNRIAANALIKLSKREWNKKTAKRLEALIFAQSPLYKASGLYALGEIALHRLSQDPVAFQADLGLQRMLERSQDFLRHGNKMVRRQALKALMKASLSGRLKALAEAPETASELREEILELLGEAPNQATTSEVRSETVARPRTG